MTQTKTEKIKIVSSRCYNEPSVLLFLHPVSKFETELCISLCYFHMGSIPSDKFYGVGRMRVSGQVFSSCAIQFYRSMCNSDRQCAHSVSIKPESMPFVLSMIFVELRRSL